MIHHIKRIKDKNCIMISVGGEKEFNEIPCPFMIKTFNHWDIEGTYLNTIKTIYRKLTASDIVWIFVPSKSHVKI